MQDLQKGLGYFLFIIGRLTASMDVSPTLNILKATPVIGGSWALRLHGLNIEREPGDVDIILYSPTSQQISILRDNAKDLYTSEEEFLDNDVRRSYKFAKGGFLLNVLIEPDTPEPPNLLNVTFNETRYLVQSITNIVAAKGSYTFIKDGKLHSRMKDVSDLAFMKNNNFAHPVDTWTGEGVLRDTEDYHE